MNFKLSRYNSRQLWFYTKRAFWILIAWVLISNALFFYEFFTLKSEGLLSSAFDFESAFTANLIVAISAGLIGGLFTVNLMEQWLRSHAFWKALLYIIGTYIAGALLISTIGALYFNSEKLGFPFYHPDVIEATQHFFSTWLFLKKLYCLVIYCYHHAYRFNSERQIWPWCISRLFNGTLFSSQT